MSDLAFGPVPAPEVDRELIEPELLDPAEPVVLRGEDDAPDASEAQVRAMLAGIGGIVSFAIGNREIEDHWRFTADELDDLTPPVTRMVNASPRLRVIVARSDTIAFALVLTRYGLRNADLQRKWSRDNEDQLQPSAGGSPVPGGDQADAAAPGRGGVPSGGGGIRSVPGTGAR